MKFIMSIKKLKRFSHLDKFNSNLFTCINYKDILPDSSKNYIQIAAFDPGVVNTGCRIERRENLPSGKVITTTIFQSLLVSADKKSDTHYFLKMNEHLFYIAKELYECDYILVESQMRTNPEAIRMSQHIISTILSIIQGSRALLIEILPTVKSKAFGINCTKGQKRIQGKELKKWAVTKSLEILKERSDEIGESIIKSSTKKDDQADVILYCDAWYRYLQTKKFSV